MPPVPVCDEHTAVTLNDRGLAKVWAHTFDDGSVDNCKVDSMDVRRMTDGCEPEWDEYGPYVLFCCEDIGEIVMVELRVWDEAGNSNTCMVEVTVVDKETPKMILPPDITVDCRFDFDPNDLSIFGKVVDDESKREDIIIQDTNYFPDYFAGIDGWAWDNCDSIIITEDPVFDLVCGVGEIRRRFTVTDPGGRSITKTQIITIRDIDRFSESDIDWPNNVTIFGCLDIDTDTSITGVPEFTNVDCAKPAFTFDDQLFTQVPDACYKIERTWTVVDWCAFDLGYRNWEWTYKQIIKVTDTVAPVLNCDKVLFCDEEAYIDQGQCVGTISFSPDVEDECTPFDDLDIRYKLDLFSTGTFGPWQIGKIIEGDYPVGQHVVLWEVSDGCGNVSRCEQEFEIKDCKAPTPYCRTGIVTVLMEGTGQITIWASDFDIGSFDNCTDTSDLKFSFSEDTTDIYRTYNCDTLNGELSVIKTVRMYVTDECGNQDYCETTIEIQDNDKCLGSLLADISGTVTDERNIPIRDLEVQLISPQDNSVIKTTTTDAQGNYTLSVIKGEAYIVAPFWDEDHMNGVSTRDLTMIQRELLGKDLLPSAYKRIAADANYTQSMSAGDIAEIRKLILGRYAKFPRNRSWRFMPADHVMSDVMNPWGVPETVSFPFIDQDHSDIDFIGMKTGDVDNSAELSGLNNNTTRYKDIYTMKYEITDLGQDRFQVDIYADPNKELTGMQATIEFDTPVELLEITSGEMEVARQNFSDHLAQEGKLTFSWTSMEGEFDLQTDRLLSLVIGGGISGIDEISVTSSVTPAEAYDQNDEVMSIATQKVSNEDQSIFELRQNVPNPFKGSTSISFLLPQAENFTLTFYDPSGRMVKKIEGYGSRGENEVLISESDFSSQVGGVIFYQLDTREQSATRKLIMLK